MSADKPIQRYAIPACKLCMWLDPYPNEIGKWVIYDDHLAAIRNARAEAFEEACKAARFSADAECDGDHEWGCNLCHGSHLAEIAIRALAAKERA